LASSYARKIYGKNINQKNGAKHTCFHAVEISYYKSGDSITNQSATIIIAAVNTCEKQMTDAALYRLAFLTGLPSGNIPLITSE
jgi:hypothetical protein